MLCLVPSDSSKKNIFFISGQRECPGRWRVSRIWPEYLHLKSIYTIGLIKCCLLIVFIYIIYKRLVKAQHSGEKEEVGGYPEEEVHAVQGAPWTLNLEPGTSGEVGGYPEEEVHGCWT